MMDKYCTQLALVNLMDTKDSLEFTFDNDDSDLNQLSINRIDSNKNPSKEDSETLKTCLVEDNYIFTELKETDNANTKKIQSKEIPLTTNVVPNQDKLSLAENNDVKEKGIQNTENQIIKNISSNNIEKNLLQIELLTNDKNGEILHSNSNNSLEDNQVKDDNIDDIPSNINQKKSLQANNSVSILVTNEIKNDNSGILNDNESDNLNENLIIISEKITPNIQRNISVTSDCLGESPIYVKMMSQSQKNSMNLTNSHRELGNALNFKNNEFKEESLMDKMHSRFIYDWSFLLSNKDKADFIIEAKDSLVHAHSLVIMARCPKLYEEIEQRNRVLKWNSLPYDAIFLFLVYLYTGQCFLSSKSDIFWVDLFDLALKYECSDLIEYLESLYANDSSSNIHNQSDLNNSLEASDFNIYPPIDSEQNNDISATKNLKTNKKDEGESISSNENIIFESDSFKSNANNKFNREITTHQFSSRVSSPDIFENSFGAMNNSYAESEKRSPGKQQMNNFEKSLNCSLLNIRNSSNKHLDELGTPLNINKKVDEKQIINSTIENSFSFSQNSSVRRSLSFQNDDQNDKEHFVDLTLSNSDDEKKVTKLYETVNSPKSITLPSLEVNEKEMKEIQSNTANNINDNYNDNLTRNNSYISNIWDGFDEAEPMYDVPEVVSTTPFKADKNITLDLNQIPKNQNSKDSINLDLKLTQKKDKVESFYHSSPTRYASNDSKPVESSHKNDISSLPRNKESSCRKYNEINITPNLVKRNSTLGCGVGDDTMLMALENLEHKENFIENVNNVSTPLSATTLKPPTVIRLMETPKMNRLRNNSSNVTPKPDFATMKSPDLKVNYNL